MFQNVSNSARIESNIKQENKFIDVVKELFSIHNCIIYILTFLVSMVSIKNEIIPFGLAIVAACIGSTVPIFMVYIISFFSTWIFHGVDGLATYFCTSAIFFIILFVFKPKISLDDRNEILKVGTRLFLASFLYNLINNIMGVFLIYDLFLGLVIAALTYTFYKIFVNGIVVIRDFGIKKAFTVEEIIAAAIIFAVAISVLKDVTIFSLSVSNILIIFIILTLGWKNGMLVGGTSGLAIGLVLTLIGNTTVLQLTVFAVSGILAGMLNKFGKIGVIIGFLLGNAILTYLVNGNTSTIIYFREIFIASVLLIFIPANVKINVEDLFEKKKLLPNNGDKSFEYYEDIRDKLNVAVQNIEDIDGDISENIENIEIKREIYIDNFLENFNDHEDNIFYDEISHNEDLIGNFFDEFQKNDIITENIMIDIFKKYNNYVLLRDQKVKDDLQELIKYANRTYRQMQMKNVKEKTKLEEKRKRNNELKNVKTIIKKISNEELNTKFENKEKEIKILLTGKGYVVNSVSVSRSLNGKYIVNIDLKYDDSIRDKAKIKNIADIISKLFGEKFSFQKDRKNLKTGLYVQTYSAEDKFALQVGSSKANKEGSKISGDSNLQIRLGDGKYLLAISDGMGSGKEARQASKFVINTLNNFLEKGFEEDDVIKLINSELNLNKNDEMYASLDMSVLDLFTGNISIVKNGACNTYIKTKNKVKIYSSKEMPVGVIENINLLHETQELNEGDIILMCSDGLLESKEACENDWISEFLKDVNTTNVQKISDLIVSEAIDNSYGAIKDDITVIVAKIIKK